MKRSPRSRLVVLALAVAGAVTGLVVAFGPSTATAAPTMPAAPTGSTWG